MVLTYLTVAKLHPLTEAPPIYCLIQIAISLPGTQYAIDEIYVPRTFCHKLVIRLLSFQGTLNFVVGQCRLVVDRLVEARKYLSSHTGKVLFFFLLSAQFNPLHTNGFLLVCYDKLGIVHCSYLGVAGYIFFKNVFFCLKISVTSKNRVDADETQYYAKILV